MNRTPRVLVISHNVFSQNSGMGKTLANMLSCIPPDEIAQLYFHAEVPTMPVCQSYCRIMDSDVLKSIATRRISCRFFDKSDVRPGKKKSRIDRGFLAQIYQFSRRRTPLIHLLRDSLWRIGKWESPQLWEWLRNFEPDVIFFASGDYSFPYKITCKIAERFDIPVILWCCDDYYLKKQSGIVLGSVYKKWLLTWVHRVSKFTLSLVVISDEMARDYGRLFAGKDIHTLRIAAEQSGEILPQQQRHRIVYAGNLGINRSVPLVALGRALRRSSIPEYEAIDVYSGEKDPKILVDLTEKNGIHFHGAASPEEIKTILGSAKYLLHVEAFDLKSRERTRYSLSTKIGESLASGACLIAYGPEEISSISYLAANDGAVILHAAEELPNVIQELEAAPMLYAERVKESRALAQRNHSKEHNDRLLRELFIAAIKGKRGSGT